MTISEDVFELASRTNARMMGTPDLPVLVIPRLSVGESRAVAEQRSLLVWDGILQALTQRKSN